LAATRKIKISSQKVLKRKTQPSKKASPSQNVKNQVDENCALKPSQKAFSN
jgi:hypothetical protein